MFECLHGDIHSYVIAYKLDISIHLFYSLVMFIKC